MSGKITKFKDLLVDTPNRYTVNGEVKTIVFSPNTITQEGTKDKAEYFNEMQKNGLYNVNATRVVEGTVEFYDIAIEGSDVFDVFDTQFIINFNETNTKLNPVLRFNGNNYYIRALKGFIDIDIQIGSLQKTYIGFLDSANNKLKLMNYEIKLTFDTIAEAQTYSGFVEGDRVQVLGYYSKNDGAGHERVYSLTDDGSGVACGVGFLNYIIKNGIVFVDHFGAYGDGVSDDYIVFSKITNKYTNIYLNKNKTYLLSNSIVLSGNKNLFSQGCTILSAITKDTALVKIRNYGNTVSGIIFDGGKTNNTLNDYKTCLDIRYCTETKIFGNTIKNFYADGIYLSNSNYTIIENNNISSVNRNIIAITSDSNYFQIKNNNFTDIIYNGVNYESSSETVVGLGIVIESNNFYNEVNQGTGLNLTGVEIGSSYKRYFNVSIKNNKFKNLLEGVQLRACQNVQLYGNTFENTRVKVSEMGECTDIEIKNNSFINSALYTYLGLKNSTISMNSIVDSTKDGITLNSILDSVVCNNLINNVGNNGINLVGTFKNIKIFDNTILDAKSIGIRISSSVSDSKLDISKNTILDLSSVLDYGIRFYGTVTNVLLKDNYIKSLYGDIMEDTSVITKIGNNTSGIFKRYGLDSLDVNYGTFNGTGDGVQTSFSFAHGGSSTPKFVTVLENNLNAGVAQISYITYNYTSISVFFKTPPSVGTFLLKYKVDF